MEINSVQNYYRMQSAATAGNTRKAADEGSTSAADNRTTDVIDISAEANFKSELGKYSKIYSANSKEVTSSERIAELKQKYQGDTCPISGSDIAGKIISGILGPGAND